MGMYEENKKEELAYLESTLRVIRKELDKEETTLDEKVKNFRTSGKEMWEESAHFSEDFDNVPEMNHKLLEVNIKTKNYENAVHKIDRYKRLLKEPYFGRFDFIEEDFDEVEKIYIGLYNLMNPETDEILIYDWRAPISSIYYRNELGKASYKSPVGLINGEVVLKRQYKIKDSKLNFFFDSSIKINDDILQEVLSRNSSSKMRNIVETIQREQDLIIRDTENDLLIVQGVAGSGKTSIALHRIAFLLYEGMSSKIRANNVIIISPNSIFSKYISHVLPELGEENVEQITFNNIVEKLLGNNYKFQSRSTQLEELLNTLSDEELNRKLENIKFKGSTEFKEILDRLIDYYCHKLIEFKDIYYDGEIIETRQDLRNTFLNYKMDMSISKKLKRIESMILNKIQPLRKKRLAKIESIVSKSDDHVFEIKSFSRLMSIREAKVLNNYLQSFTEVDYLDLYKRLFSKRQLFIKMSEGLGVPKDIEKMLIETKKSFEQGNISYEDSAALLYLKLKLEGADEFKDIKQVVIDEAQDYYPIQYEIFKILFKEARYTVLGDFNQTLEKYGEKSLYDEVEKILYKRKSVKLCMNKSYRSSFEINAFNKKFLSNNEDFVSFDRHEEEVKLIFKENKDALHKALAEDIKNYYKEGYSSVAVICKTQKESEALREHLERLTGDSVLTVKGDEIEKGTVVLPSYLAKGLEFDVVLVYDVTDEKYKSNFHKRLLYVACTRALHKLALYYNGKKSLFI